MIMHLSINSMILKNLFLQLQQLTHLVDGYLVYDKETRKSVFKN